MSNPLILVADDNEGMRDFYRETLSDFEFDMVSSGAGLLLLAMKHPYRLILTDLVMPDISGSQAAKIIRAQPGPNKNTTIYACTGDLTEAARLEMQESGFDHALEKPINLDLLRRIFGWASEPDLPDFVRPVD